MDVADRFDKEMVIALIEREKNTLWRGAGGNKKTDQARNEGAHSALDNLRWVIENIEIRTTE